jgi:hypothetical protein
MTDRIHQSPLPTIIRYLQNHHINRDLRVLPHEIRQQTVKWVLSWKFTCERLRVKVSRLRLKQDRQCTYNVTLSNKHLILVCVCMLACVRACGYPSVWACACAYVNLALLIQHATRMRHIVTSFMAPRSSLYFSTLSHKRCDFS